MEKPTKVEPGQRYDAGGMTSQQDVAVVVTKVDGGTVWYEYESGGITGPCYRDVRNFLDLAGPLLAPSTAPASPAPAVGQRWRDTHTTDVYTLTSQYGGGWYAKCDSSSMCISDANFRDGRLAYVDTPATPPASHVPVWEVGQRRRGPIYQDHMSPPDAKHQWKCNNEKDDTYTLRRRLGNGAWATDSWHVNESWPSELLSPSTPVQPTATAPAKECLPCTTKFFEAGAHTCGASAAQDVPQAHEKETPVSAPAAAAVTPAFSKREVSNDGKTFIPYELLPHADAFETWPWRKLDGVLQLSAWAQYVEGDRVAAMMTEMEQSSRVTGTWSPPDTRPKPQSFVHDRGCLGIWNTRGR